MWKMEEKFEFDQSLVKRAVFVGVDYQARFCRLAGEKPYDIGRYCGTRETDKACRDANDFVRFFDDVGIDVAWVYIDGMTTDEGAFHHIQPKPHHHIIPKYNESAFVGHLGQKQSDFLQYVNDHGKDILFVAGVNLNICVLNTVYSALEAGLHVVLVPDLSADSCGMMAHFNNQSIFGKLGSIKELQHQYYRAEMARRFENPGQGSHVYFGMNQKILQDESSTRAVHAWVETPVLARALTRLKLQQDLNRVMRGYERPANDDEACSSDMSSIVPARIQRRRRQALTPTSGWGASK